MAPGGLQRKGGASNWGFLGRQGGEGKRESVGQEKEKEEKKKAQWNALTSQQTGSRSETTNIKSGGSSSLEMGT